MNAKQMLTSLQVGTVIPLPPVINDKALILAHGEYTGFGAVHHIVGSPSLVAMITKLLGRSFMCASGTEIERTRALAKLFFDVWKLDPEVELLQLAADSKFTDFSPDGGTLATSFRIVRLVKGVFYGNECTEMVLDCTIKNRGVGRERIVFRGTLTLKFVDTHGMALVG